jgi:hypothetical protein
VGVQLVHALDLIRQAAVSAGCPVGPILVIAYKNHALDEILMDVVTASPAFQPVGRVIRCGNSEDVRLKPRMEKHSAFERQAQNVLQVMLLLLMVAGGLFLPAAQSGN